MRNVICLALVVLVVAPFSAIRAGAQAANDVRIVHFPIDRSLGNLHLRVSDAASDTISAVAVPDLECGDLLGKAQGDVRVPPNRQLILVVNPTAIADISSLSSLRPDDLYGIEFPYSQERAHQVTDAVMPYVAHLTSLKSLSLSSTNVTDAGMRYLVALRSLESLETPAQATDKGMASVAQLTSLRHLRLYGPSQVTDAGLATVSKLTSLEELTLFGERMGDAGLAHLRRLPRLELLMLRGTHFGDAGMAYLKELASLKRLGFSEGAAFISDVGLARIAEILGLEELGLDTRGDVTEEGLAHLVKLRSLKRLALPRTRLTDVGLAHLKQIKTLETLVLSAGIDEVTDVGLSGLGELSNLKCLTIAYSPRAARNLQARPYTDKGLESLARCRNMEELFIGSPAVTNEGLGQVAKLGQLKRLSMWYCTGVTDAGLAKLAALDQLTSLNVDSANITVAGINKLKPMSRLTSLSVRGLKRGDAVLDIRTMTNLELLSLGFVAYSEQFQDADLRCLSGLRHLVNLQLGARDFSDAGLASLAELTNIEVLGIGGSRLTDEGLMHLTKMKNLNSLYILRGFDRSRRGYVSGGNITDQGLKILEGFERLSFLEIYSDSDFSDGALRRLQRALPNLSALRINGGFLSSLPEPVSQRPSAVLPVSRM